MIVCVDTNFVVKWLSVYEMDCDDKHRIDLLFDQIGKSHGKIIIPMPCFAEFLVHIDEAAMEWISNLERKRSVVIAPFDRRAAFECALLDKAALGTGNKRGGRPATDNWQKIKIDRQAIAIARTNNADFIISGDEGLRKTAISAGIKAVAFDELDIPEYAKQQKLPLTVPKDEK